MCFALGKDEMAAKGEKFCRRMIELSPSSNAGYALLATVQFKMKKYGFSFLFNSLSLQVCWVHWECEICFRIACQWWWIDDRMLPTRLVDLVSRLDWPCTGGYRSYGPDWPASRSDDCICRASDPSLSAIQNTSLEGTCLTLLPHSWFSHSVAGYVQDESAVEERHGVDHVSSQRPGWGWEDLHGHHCRWS